MKEKVKHVLELMRLLGVTIEDLTYNFNSIAETKKFPLEVLFMDGTRTFDASPDKSFLPCGIIIDGTIFALPYRLQKVQSYEEAERYCAYAFPSRYQGILPNGHDIEKLTENFAAYNQIATYFGYEALSKERMLIVPFNDDVASLNCYDMERKEYFFDNRAYLLPVMP